MLFSQLCKKQRFFILALQNSFFGELILKLLAGGKADLLNSLSPAHTFGALSSTLTPVKQNVMISPLSVSEPYCLSF